MSHTPPSFFTTILLPIIVTFFGSLKVVCAQEMPQVAPPESLYSGEPLSASKSLSVPDASLAYKLTTGYYRFAKSAAGWDINLRQSSNLGNVWLGSFNLADQGVSQWRVGWDRSFGKTVRISPSVQFASGGFVGGSIQAEIGEPWFASVGFGRTNLKPYYNLNFDPNDSYQLSFGKRSENNELMMVQYIRDNRENPDQRHLHLVYHRPMDRHQRLSVDVLIKAGLVSGQTIRRAGLTLTYDWQHWFARVAWDPYSNFTPENVLRLSVGARF